MRRWLVCAGLLLIGGLGAGITPALGHGILQGASPSPDALPTAPPSQITLSFTETADPAFTSVAVVDQQGRRVSTVSRLSADGRRVTASLAGLSRGRYTVRWRMLSAVDGHTTTGTYSFTVGGTVAAPPPSPPQPGESPREATQTGPPLLQVAARWVSYATALLLAGAAMFAYFIVRPALVRAEPHLAVSVDGIATAAVRRLSVLAAIGLLLSLGLGLVVQMQILLDAPLQTVFASGQWAALLTGTRLGWSVLLQAVMAAILLVPETRRGRVFRMAAVIWAAVAGTLALIASSPGEVTASQHILHLTVLLLIGTVYGLVSVMAAIILPLVPDLRLPQAQWAAPAAAAILLVGMTLNSHAAGAGWLALAADWAHVAAAAIWIGGLAGLIVTLQTAPIDLRTGVARTLVPRFSAVAGVSVFVLVVTGTYAAWVNLPAWQAFTATPYGQALLVKLLLVVPWIGLGMFNHFVLRPRLSRGANRPVVRTFVRLTGGEVTIAGAVLLTVAVLTITPPARVTFPVPDERGVVFAGIDRGARVRLTVQPVRAGWNRYAVTVDPGGARLPAGGRVELRFLKLDADAAPSVLALSPAGSEYRGEGAELAAGGWWRIDVVVGRDASPALAVGFPMFLENGPNVPLSDEAARILTGALQRSQHIGSWRQSEQITDGNGNAVATRYAFSVPDRVQYETSSGGEAVIVGTTRYTREGGDWRMDRLPAPIPVRGPYVEYLRGAEQPVFGRRDLCGGEPCRVVFWQIPPAQARFAAWIGLRSLVIYRLLMVAPQHYMTATAFDFNVAVSIVPPK